MPLVEVGPAPLRTQIVIVRRQAEGSRSVVRVLRKRVLDDAVEKPSHRAPVAQAKRVAAQGSGGLHLVDVEEIRIRLHSGQG